MTTGARTPDELDTLLEDAFVLRDASASRTLFDDDAVLGEAAGPEAHGGAAIGRALAKLWTGDCTYVARTKRVLRTRDTALIVADAGIHVVRRGHDGTWRAAISLLDLHTSTRPEET
jgi:hypothetical protein